MMMIVVSSAVVAMIVTHQSSVVTIALSIVPQYSRLPRLWQQQQQLCNDRQCSRRIELYSVNGKNNNNNEFAQANIAVDDEVDRRARAAESSSSSLSDINNDNDSVTATVKLVESWLITHLPTLSSTDLQYYATSLISDGYDTISKLNSIHSPNVELVDPSAILFMKKAHRRVLMKKIGLVMSARPPTTRLTPPPTTTTTTTQRSSSSRDEDFAVNSAATLRAKYKAEVEKQKEIEKNNIAVDESATPSSSTSTTDTTRDDDEGTWEDVYSIMDDLSTRYITMDTTKMDGGTCGDKEERRKELVRLKELKQGLLSSSSSSSSSSNDAAVTIGNEQEERGEYNYDFIEDDLSKRYSTMDHDAMLLMPNRETRDKELRRLRELNDLLPGMNKAGMASSPPPSVFIPPRNSIINNNNNNDLQVENDIMDDVSARYSSLDNVKMALDGGHTDKQLRRLRDIKETLIQRRSRKKKSSYRDDKLDDDNASSYLSDNLTKWYDSTKGKSAVTTIVNNVNSSKKESRRLDELKKKAQEFELKATRLNYLSSRKIIQDEEPLRLDLLQRKQTENDTNYFDRKERMRLESLASIIEKKKTINETRIMELQRLVATRLSTEENKNSSAQQSIEHPTIQLHDEYDKYRPRKSGSVGYASTSDDGTELIYKTNEKGRLDDLEKYLNKRRGNRLLATTATTPPNGKDDDGGGGDDDNTQAVVSTPLPPPPTNRGVRLVSDKLYGVVTELCNLDIEEEDCWDITRRPNFDTRIRNTNIDQRKSISSLSTTLPPTNRGVRIIRRDKNSSNTNEDMDVELCDLEQDDDCWDITRQPNFDERTRNINVDQRKSIQSLSTTMSPSYNDLSSETSTILTKGTVSSVTSTTAVSSLLPDRKGKVQSDDPIAKGILSENNMNVFISSSATNTSRNFPKGKPSLSDEDTNYHIISIFPKERPSLLVNTGTRRDFTTLGTYDDRRFISGSDRSGMKNKSRFKTRDDDAPDEQYVDKPRSFQGNLELTSNMSGRRFKTSSDLRYKRNNADVWLMSDIDGMAMTQRSRIVPSSSSSSSFQPTYSSELDSVVPTSSNNNSDNYTGEEKLMHWLLTHLPNIEEDDAVQYFNCLVEDGFDSIDVSEILEEDLSFMKSIHKQILLQSLQELERERESRRK